MKKEIKEKCKYCNEKAIALVGKVPVCEKHYYKESQKFRKEFKKSKKGERDNDALNNFTNN